RKSSPETVGSEAVVPKQCLELLWKEDAGSQCPYERRPCLGCHVPAICRELRERIVMKGHPATLCASALRIEIARARFTVVERLQSLWRIVNDVEQQHAVRLEVFHDLAEAELRRPSVAQERQAVVRHDDQAEGRAKIEAREIADVEIDVYGRGLRLRSGS